MSLSKYIPDRKFLASGIAGAVAFAIVLLTGIDGEVATAAVAGVMALVHYFVPASVSDIIRRVDDRIIDLARASDESPASPTEHRTAGG